MKSFMSPTTEIPGLVNERYRTGLFAMHYRYVASGKASSVNVIEGAPRYGTDPRRNFWLCINAGPADSAS